MLITAVLWGSAFVFMSQAMDYIGPFTFVFVRFLFGSLSLLLLLLAKRGTFKKDKKAFFRSVKAGFLCGLPLCAGMIFQQMGITDNSAGKTAFLTSMYIVLVPLINIFYGSKIQKQDIIAILLAVVGFYFLCVKEAFQIEKSDWVTLMGALSFAAQIVFIDHYGKDVDPVVQSWISQSITCIVGLVLMLSRESFSLSGVQMSLLPILYCALVAGSFADTLQIIGQKSCRANVASLIMSLESVFGALFGFVFLHEMLSIKEIVGCVFIFAGVLYSQWKEK